ncbi:MAG: hypothetical protein ACJ8R9_24350 [Steroidobacteraceae bacterium]
MYVLEYLKSAPQSSHEFGVTFEYRLLCSGELYNSKVSTSDWRKSNVAQYLCGSSFTILAVRNPLRHFPQELVVRFKANRVEERGAMASVSFVPDEDIARDLAALLSVIFRRLVTVAGKTRELYPRFSPNDIEELLDTPLPLVNALDAVHWQERPLGITWTYGDDRQQVIDYNPRPRGIDPHELQGTLLAIPNIPNTQSFVLSARLYALGLLQLDQDVSLSFHSLISAIETLASAAFKDYRPPEQQVVNAKQSVATLATGTYGLSESAARQPASSRWRRRESLHGCSKSSRNS